MALAMPRTEHVERPLADAAGGAPSARRGIEVRGLTKQFEGAYLSRDFDVDLPAGEFISIFGPNGCGKSTLINMISGMLPADGGAVKFDGRPIADCRYSYVFQNYR